MPLPPPHALPAPPEILLSIRLPTWHALFTALGYPPGVTPSTDSLSAIATALRSADLPLRLARAIFTIAAFSTEPARADIYNAATALAHPTRWPDAASPADLVALLLAAAVTDDAVAELLEAAQILRDRSFRPHATLLYVGVPGVDPVVGEPIQYADAWRTAFAAWAKTRDFGAVAPVDARLESGTLSYEIIHEDRLTTSLVDAPPTTTRASPPFTLTSSRPLRSHRVTYNPTTRRLWITTDCMEAATALATIAGVVFFENPRHFLDAEAVALWKLQEDGPASLVVPELSAKLTMSAVGGTWHSGKNHAITPRGRDFFKALARYKIRIEGGRLDLVTLRAKLLASAGGPKQCDVALRPPHLVTVSEPELAPLMHDFLDGATITSPAPRPRDFYSLQPWIDFSAGWIASEGEAGFAQLVRDGVLKPDPANRAVTPPDHLHAGPTATAYPLRGTRFLAWSADPTVAPFLVEERDLVVYSLSFAKLALVIASALGLEGPAAALDDDGALYCGRRVLGPTHVLVFLLTRPIRSATAARLRDAAAHGHALLIAPERRVRDNGLRHIAMPKLAGPWQPLLGAIVRALNLESFVETTLYAPLDARIVLHRATMRVWIDGVLCAALNEMHFRLFEILIAHAGKPLHTKEIAEHVAQGRPHEDTTRKVIESFALAVAKSFKQAKQKPPKDLRSFITKPRLAHYVLNVSGFVG